MRRGRGRLLKVALVRAGGDRTVLLRDVRDQAFN
jgi:hypothetical protein